MGAWKPFFDVVESSLQRACKAHGVDCRLSDAAALHGAIPTWQPHPNVVEGLQAIAPHIPLVIPSNSMVGVGQLRERFFRGDLEQPPACGFPQVRTGR